LAIGNAPVVHEVPVERLRGGAVRFGEGLDAGPVLLVLLLLLKRSGERLDPFGGHGYFFPSSCWCAMGWSCSIRSARKLQAFQNSSRYARPLGLSVYTSRGGPFPDGPFATSTGPRCSPLTSSA